MRCCAPGTLDRANYKEETIFGVSSTLWKGSSGGPCVILDGPSAGAIIGLGKHPPLLKMDELASSASANCQPVSVRGYETFTDPYNLVAGFPNDLKAQLRQMID